MERADKDIHTHSRRKFTPEEDDQIRKAVALFGNSSWVTIAKHVQGRTSRQCRERWVNYLDPEVNKVSWTIEEDMKLQNLVEQYGQKWSRMVGHFDGRTDVMIKNRYTLIKRRIQRGEEYKKVKSVPTKIEVPQVNNPILTTDAILDLFQKDIKEWELFGDLASIL